MSSFDGYCLLQLGLEEFIMTESNINTALGNKEIYEAIDNNNNHLQNPSIESEELEDSNEIELTELTEDQTEIYNFLKQIIQESFDPWCPLIEYVTPRRFFKAIFYDEPEETVYMQFTSLDAAKASLVKRKEFKSKKLKSFIEINENAIPAKSKIINKKDGVLFSFTLDFSFSKPKWFSILYAKKVNRLEIVYYPSKDNSNELISRALNEHPHKMVNGLCVFDAPATHNDLMKLLRDIRPILKQRFDFLYEHRLTESCCCQLQSGTVTLDYYKKIR